MTAQQLAELVAEMRSAQKRFFQRRSDASLERAKQLEKQVDEACKRLLEQPTLFDEAD